MRYTLPRGDRCLYSSESPIVDWFHGAKLPMSFTLMALSFSGSGQNTDGVGSAENWSQRKGQKTSGLSTGYQRAGHTCDARYLCDDAATLMGWGKAMVLRYDNGGTDRNTAANAHQLIEKRIKVRSYICTRQHGQMPQLQDIDVIKRVIRLSLNDVIDTCPVRGHLCE